VTPERRTKIVATLGPASESPEQLRALVAAGMDAARLNLSHGTHADHAERARRVREVEAEVGRPIALIGDLQGPKLRIGELAEPVILTHGEQQTNCAEDSATDGDLDIAFGLLLADAQWGSSGAIDYHQAARDVIADMRDEVRQVREYSAVWPDRPRVYFEEWMDPMISGIRWVSELIEIAGGRDIFAELRPEGSAQGRVVTSEQVLARDPQIILASWCGKPVDREAIVGRPGWDRLSAVKAGEIHEIAGEDVLSPGPSLMLGLRRIHELIQAFVSG